MTAIAKLWLPGVGGSRFAISLLTWLIAAALVIQAARLVLLTLDAPYVASGPPIPLPDSETSSGAAEGALANWHLFGKTAQAAPLFQLLDLPDTPLALSLRGIVAAPDGTDGYALIADERGSEAVYRLQSDVPGGAKVVAIRPDQVVLERAGRREILRLERNSALAETAGTGGAGTFGASPATPPAGTQSTGGQAAPMSITAALPNLMPGIRMDAGQLANSLQVMPVSGGGFRVFPGRDSRLFAEIGLEANDIVEQINGRTLTNPAEALTLFQQVQSGESLSITVRRGERQIVLRPDMKRLRATQPGN